MDGRPDGIQMTQFRVVSRRSSTAGSFWCRKSQRFRKKCWCSFAEVHQGLESTDTLYVLTTSSEVSAVPTEFLGGVMSFHNFPARLHLGLFRDYLRSLGCTLNLLQ